MRGGGGGGVYFFFQAEDGIRDRLVTGVQTCALPICEAARSVPTALQETYDGLGLAALEWPESYGGAGLTTVTRALVEEELAWGCAGLATSSEERRGGQEWRARWSPYH